MLLLHRVGFSRNTAAAEAEDYINDVAGDESKYKLRVMVRTEIITKGKTFEKLKKYCGFFQIQFGTALREFTSTFF